MGNYIVKQKPVSGRTEETQKDDKAHGSPGAPGAGHSRSPIRKAVTVTPSI
jgi:hypothetical protein